MLCKSCLVLMFGVVFAPKKLLNIFARGIFFRRAHFIYIGLESYNKFIIALLRVGQYGNIQFSAGSIGPSAARDNTEAEN